MCRRLVLVVTVVSKWISRDIKGSSRYCCMVPLQSSLIVDAIYIVSDVVVVMGEHIYRYNIIDVH